MLYLEYLFLYVASLRQQYHGLQIYHLWEQHLQLQDFLRVQSVQVNNQIFFQQ